MAFTSTITSQTRGGIFKLVWGTYDAASVATGELDTGINQNFFMTLQPKASSVITTGSSIDETIPFTQGRTGTSLTTIDTATSETGYWLAIGKG